MASQVMANQTKKSSDFDYRLIDQYISKKWWLKTSITDAHTVRVKQQILVLEKKLEPGNII